MSRLLRLCLVAIVLLVSLPASPTLSAGASSTCEPDGRQASGAIYRICMPEAGRWNGDLVVYAHGYVAFNEPVKIPEDQLELPGGLSIPQIVNGLGFAFATTSYRTNGLAVLPAIEDLRDLVHIFSTTHGQPRRVYLTGASEGGIITALSVEQFPDIYAGGLAICGPVGDFRKQINYWGDFRVVFDYFFPGLIPGSAVNVPQDVIDNWDAVYRPRVLDAIRSNSRATDQLLRVTNAPIDRGDPASKEATILDLLWYNVFATNDGIAKLGGQPFDNSHRRYSGSAHDARLNRQVARFHADPAAVNEIEAHYQTSGRLVSPLVTLHTTGDPIVPYWHEPLYRAKVRAGDSSARHTNLPVLRYGHCNFKPLEVVLGFALLVLKTTGQELAGAESVLPDAASRAEYLRLARQYGGTILHYSNGT